MFARLGGRRRQASGHDSSSIKSVYGMESIGGTAVHAPRAGPRENVHRDSSFDLGGALRESLIFDRLRLYVRELLVAKSNRSGDDTEYENSSKSR